MLAKEDFRPRAPTGCSSAGAVRVGVLLAGGVRLHPVRRHADGGDRVVPLQAITLNVGILYVFGMLSLGVYG
jgi:hypothetical protein